MVKDFIDTNEFTREQLVDMIELSLAIKRAIRSGYYPPLMQDMTLEFPQQKDIRNNP